MTRQPSSDRPVRSPLPLLGIALAAGLLSGCASLSFPMGSLADAAERDLGKTNVQAGLPATLSCADGVNKWRRQAGFRPVNSRRAIDQASAGKRVTRPVRGDLLITRRGRYGHHVDVITAVNSDGTVTVIGANVNRMVALRVLPVSAGIVIRPT